MLITALTLGVVVLNALVVNTTYQLQAVQEQQRAAAEARGDLEIEVARLSSPSRISGWAAENGMVLPAPDDVVPLQVRGSGGGGGE